MAKPGVIAFPVLLALGAITGYLTYTWFTAAIPQEGLVQSPYRKELIPVEASEEVEKIIDESRFSSVVTIKILHGASAQGSPDYGPDAAKAGPESLLTWVNEDVVPHTATSGTGAADSKAGALFDSEILTQG